MTENSLKVLRVIAFPGAPNLPIFAAMAQGYFAREGLDVALELTPSSVYQAEQTAKGDFDLVCTAFDNVVAYTEKQGAAGADVDPDYVVVMGATQLELSLVVSSDIKTFQDLKGKTIALDAKATGFAFVLSEMLEKAGLVANDTEFVTVGATPQRWRSVKSGEHAATLTIEPFTSIATRSGFNVLQTSSDLFSAYQGGVVATRRAFAAENPGHVRGFLRAYLKGLDWVTDPANRDTAAKLLQDKMPAIQPQAIAAVMTSVLSPRSGLSPEGRLLPEGMARVLDLRSRHGAGDAVLKDVERYLDLQYYEDVMKEPKR
jgi:ABC-type nitrate/sulfonate/bicarbonate transport system substrate-binding protein